MKKEENQKRKLLKIEPDLRSRSHSPKAYLGCDTCKLRNIKSNSKISDYGVVQDRNKIKSHPSEKDERENKNKDVKLIDLCDEDKKRIVELIEELSKIAEKNQELKAAIDQLQKDKQEQQEYTMKQAQLHLEEKNFYVNEVGELRSRIEEIEKERRTNTFQWESRERCKDNEIAYLTKALQKLHKEKNQLIQQMGHLKICLRHSLESFQRLRAEVSELQHQELGKNHKTVSVQTDIKSGNKKEKPELPDQEETEEEEEFMSTCNQDTVKAKSSLDIINDKLEYVYQMLKRKNESLTKCTSQKHEIDLSAFPRNETLASELDTENLPLGFRELKTEDPTSKEDDEDSENKFQKPFDGYSKTSVQAERILKQFGKPLNLDQSTKSSENNKKGNVKCKESARDTVTFSNFLQHKIIQKNTLFKTPEDQQYNEDKLLEELFYPEQSANFGMDYLSKPEIIHMKTNFQGRPFTW